MASTEVHNRHVSQYVYYLVVRARTTDMDTQVHGSSHVHSIMSMGRIKLWKIKCLPIMIILTLRCVPLLFCISMCIHINIYNLLLLLHLCPILRLRRPVVCWHLTPCPSIVPPSILWSLLPEISHIVQTPPPWPSSPPLPLHFCSHHPPFYIILIFSSYPHIISASFLNYFLEISSTFVIPLMRSFLILIMNES